MNFRNYYYLLAATLFLSAGCANIVPPAGGAIDKTPPKLISVAPADSQKNVRTAKIRLNFDEYITVNDANNQVIISPLLPVPPTVISLNKHVTISFPDSLLLDNTTYHITFGNAIRDNHENNIYKSNGYIFSTGIYFDSLSISGRTMNSLTGRPDSSATILLYNAADGDSALLKKKPMYATHVGSDGSFTLQGLPQRNFRIFALRDKNTNLTFDDRSEWIAFIDHTIIPGIDSEKIILNTFPAEGTDTIKTTTSAGAKSNSRKPSISGATGYAVLIDTNDVHKRTKEITEPLTIAFSKQPGAINKEKIFLTSDSLGITVEKSFVQVMDTSTHYLKLETKWDENSVYTLRLQKGFAKDSAGNDLLPSRYTFRTKRDDDYAKLSVHLPTKYYGEGFIFQVCNNGDTIYQQVVTDSVVNLLRIPPGNYTLRIIVDKNKNGRWDTGDLFAKKQPETVVPYDQTIMLKAGWENQVDFIPPVSPSKKSPENSSGRVPK